MLPNCTFAISRCPEYEYSIGVDWSVAATIRRRRRITSRSTLRRLPFMTDFDAVAHVPSESPFAFFARADDIVDIQIRYADLD